MVKLQINFIYRIEIEVFLSYEATDKHTDKHTDKQTQGLKLIIPLYGVKK